MNILKNFELDIDISSGQLTYVPSPNFSYSLIPPNCCIIVPIYQEMILNKRITIQGKLVLKGNLIFVR